MSTPAIDYDALAAQHGGAPQVDYDALAAQHGGSVASPATSDTRNGVQRFVDNLTTVTPEQEKGHSWLTNKAQEFGAGAIQGATAPFVHPQQTLEGIGQLLTTNPLTTGKQMIQSAIANPAQTAGNLVGGAVLGEAAAPAIAPAVKLAGKTAGRAALLGKTPEGAYESALKPSTTLSQAERESIVKTGLQNEIPISKAGLEKLGDRIDTLNDAIKNEIASDPTRPIDPNKVATRADIAKAKFANQVNARPDLDAIEASRHQFLHEQGATLGMPAPDMAAAKAQAMKQGTYRVLAGKYGEQGSASVEAQKALARGLKEEIAQQFPEIDKLNATESRLLDLQPILERAVNRISNHQLIGIGTPVAGAAAKAVTGSSGVGAIAGVMKAVLDNPAVKSRLAIAVSKAQKIPFGQASAKVQAYSAALGATGAATQGYSSGDTPTQ